MKYITIGEDDIIRPVEELNNESCDVALAIAFGKDYADFGIDPVKAYILVDRVNEFAKHRGIEVWEKMCTRTLDMLRVHAQAYCTALEADDKYEEAT